MAEYIILPGRKLPMRYLSYTSSHELVPGQLVEIPIRASKEVGLVIQKAEEKNEKKELALLLKAVSKILPFGLSSMQMNFLFALSNNTMNSPGLLLQNFYQPYKLLTQKRLKQLELEDTRPSQDSSKIFDQATNNGTIDFIVDLNISVRIMYLIRSVVLKNNEKPDKLQTPLNRGNMAILVLFPEKKYLNVIYQEIVDLLKSEFKDLTPHLQHHKFISEPVKSSKDTVWDLLQTQSDKIHLIFATRAGLFLPYNQLTAIFLVDEANSLHIQDQNSVYFDSREAVFLLARSYNADLFFISKLPSIRLHSFYPESVLNEYMSNIAANTANGLKLQITQRDSKYDQNSLVSAQVLEQIKSELEDDTQLYFGEDETQK